MSECNRERERERERERVSVRERERERESGLKQKWFLILVSATMV